MEKINNAQELREYLKSTDTSCLTYWELENGDSIAYKRDYETPHLISPEESDGAVEGDFGWEKAISYEEAFRLLDAENLLTEPEDYE